MLHGAMDGFDRSIGEEIRAVKERENTAMDNRSGFSIAVWRENGQEESDVEVRRRWLSVRCRMSS